MLFQYIYDQIILTLSIEGLKGYVSFLFLAGVMFWLVQDIFFEATNSPYSAKNGPSTCFFLPVNFFVFNAISIACLIEISELINASNFHNFQAQIAKQPYWLQFFEIVFLCDICIYCAHRLSHKYKLLWRFHKIHHTAEQLDWLAAYREHPLDNDLYSRH